MRLTQTEGDHIARGHIDALVNVIGATGGALMLAFDQLEQSRVQGWEARLRHLFGRGALLAETLPPLCVAYAVLPSLYDTIAEGIDSSIRDRIERFGSLPVRLKPLARRQAEALLKRRLSELFERCGAKPDAKDPLYPFPGWMTDELGGQTSRYVFELIQQFRRVYLATGAVPALEDMPPPPSISSDAPIAPAASAAAGSINFDDKWHGELTSRTVQPAIGNGIQQAEILEWAIQAAAIEIDGLTAIKTRRTVRGRAGTVVIEADFQLNGQSVERREIALCNEGRGAPAGRGDPGFPAWREWRAARYRAPARRQACRARGGSSRRSSATPRNCSPSSCRRSRCSPGSAWTRRGISSAISRTHRAFKPGSAMRARLPR